MSRDGIIFNIQRFTIHDGPGLRTELFLKGCPMKCDWCSNPESQMTYIQPGVYKSKCISHKKCGACESVCREGALHFYRGKLVSIDRERCTNCLACYDACPSDAIKRWGESMSVEACMEEIRKDRGYYDRSGGGVTVSGGEPLLQSNFVAELFHACKAEGIHTCCETTFCADWEAVEKILPDTDLIISDLKHMDAAVHKKYTGVGNARILENLKRLTSENRELILRIPVIPNVNDDRENVEATADFILGELGGRVRTLQLLSFMRLGEEKYRSLEMPYKMDIVRVNRKAFQKHVDELADYFNNRGIHCLVGTKEKH
ncbi:MAG: glycyl-radical enzyme activating protein [Pseudoflavonifractor sp.]|nr:glycyl-radical enzyme activating protein [Pseudoflavonifractor sp.]